jgi:hypothetical protein
VLPTFDEIIPVDLQMRLALQSDIDLRRGWLAVQRAQLGLWSEAADALRHVLLSSNLSRLLLSDSRWHQDEEELAALEEQLTSAFDSGDDAEFERLVALKVELQHRHDAYAAPAVVMMLLSFAMQEHRPHITDDWPQRPSHTLPSLADVTREAERWILQNEQRGRAAKRLFNDETQSRTAASVFDWFGTKTGGGQIKPYYYFIDEEP